MDVDVRQLIPFSSTVVLLLQSRSKNMSPLLHAYNDQGCHIIMTGFVCDQLHVIAIALLQAYIDHGCHIIVTGAVCDPGDRGEALRSVLASDCPLERLLIASDAPYATPQVKGGRTWL
jgi:hypothetical protein